MVKRNFKRQVKAKLKSPAVVEQERALRDAVRVRNLHRKFARVMRETHRAIEQGDQALLALFLEFRERVGYVDNPADARDQVQP
jgi:hypothetical protein